MSLLNDIEQRKYARELEDLDDEDFVQHAFSQIDRANQHTIYSVHDQRASMCCAEARRRGKIELYQRAFTAAYRVAKGDQHYAVALNALTGAA